MAGHFAGITTTTIAVGINGMATIKKGHDPFPGFLAGGILVTAVVLLGEATDPRLAAAFGATFLVGVLLINGPVLLDTVSKIVGAKD